VALTDAAPTMDVDDELLVVLSVSFIDFSVS